MSTSGEGQENEASSEVASKDSRGCGRDFSRGLVGRDCQSTSSFAGTIMARPVELGSDFHDDLRGQLAATALAAVASLTMFSSQKLQITGTPTFVVGDRILCGYVPLDGMREAVTEERG